MKFSHSLLNTDDIGLKIFNNGVQKSKELLTEVFGLDFINGDSRIVGIVDDCKNYNFEVIFNLNGREITVDFIFETEKDIVIEVLRIREIEECSIEFNSISDDFIVNINKVFDYLEDEFDLDFTPLDPIDIDTNIKEINKNQDEKTLKIIFTQDHHEGWFEAEYKYIQDEKQIIKIVQYKEHKIYLD